MLAISLAEAKSSYEEKHDTTQYIKNIISDNILPGELYAQAKELNFDTEVQRAVYILHMEPGVDASIMNYLQPKYVKPNQDYLFSISMSDLTLIKVMTANAQQSDIVRYAQLIHDAVLEDLGREITIGVSTMVVHLRELADRYKEAKTALEIGRVFDGGQSVISYSKLGLGRIIYQLPTTLCGMYLEEVFQKNSIEALDEEILYTIDKFFENNLNVSETSRKLFVHRNTLVYRLEKIKRITGLDIREFDNAIVFKVALMVKKYLDSQSYRR